MSYVGRCDKWFERVSVPCCLRIFMGNAQHKDQYEIYETVSSITMVYWGNCYRSSDVQVIHVANGVFSQVGWIDKVFLHL